MKNFQFKNFNIKNLMEIKNLKLKIFGLLFFGIFGGLVMYARDNTQMLLTKKNTEYARGYPYKKESCASLKPRLLIGKGDSGNVFDGTSACVANGHLDWALWENVPYEIGDLNAGSMRCRNCKLTLKESDSRNFHAKLIAQSDISLVMKGIFGTEKVFSDYKNKPKIIECYEDCEERFDNYQGLVEIRLQCSRLIETITGSLTINGTTRKLVKYCDETPPSCTSKVVPETWTHGPALARVDTCSDPDRCLRTTGYIRNIEVPGEIKVNGATGQAKIVDRFGNEKVCSPSSSAKIDKNSPFLIQDNNAEEKVAGISCKTMNENGSTLDYDITAETEQKWTHDPVMCSFYALEGKEEMSSGVSGISSILFLVWIQLLIK